MKRIKLTQGKYALIDEGDFELVSKYKWYCRFSGKTSKKNWYAQSGGSSKPSVFMHNIIISPPIGLYVDHINRKGWDNRRSNLRIVTLSQQMANFPTKSKLFRGVHYHKRLDHGTARPYEAYIKSNGKLKSLGTFKTAIEAAKTYNAAAKVAFGECAQLNKL